METNVNKEDFLKRGRHHGHGIGFASFLIMLGGIFLLLNLGIIPAEYKPVLISWQMLLIVLGIGALIKRSYTKAVVLIAIGGFFIYPQLWNILSPNYLVHIDFRTYWPILPIIIGIFLVISHFFRPKKDWDWKCQHKRHSKHNNYKSVDQDSADLIEKNMMFGSAEQIILSQNFRGGDANVMFGELIIDLRKAKLAEGSNLLEVNIMFGSIVIYVSADWIVELQSNTVFGAFEDKRYQHNESVTENAPRLVIKGSALFGSGEIRN